MKFLLTLDDPYDVSVQHISFVTYRRVTEAWSLKSWANPREWVLGMAVGGACRYWLGEQEVRIESGQMLLIPPRVARSARCGPKDGFAFFSVGFEISELTADAQERLRGLPRVVHSRQRDQAQALFNQLHQGWAQQEPGLLLRSRGYLSELLNNYICSAFEARASQPHARRIRRVIELIQSSRCLPLQIDELAEAADMSASYLRQVFRAYTGEPLLHYQNRVRIERAKNLLLSGDCNVSQAAERLGFNDIYYFSKLFKRITGLNPSRYRDALDSSRPR